MRANLRCAGVEPKYMGISPIAAIQKVLAQTGLTKEDIDIFEVCVVISGSNNCLIVFRRSTKLSPPSLHIV